MSKKNIHKNISTKEEEEEEGETESFSLQFFEDTNKADVSLNQKSDDEESAERKTAKKPKRAPQEFFGDDEEDLVDYLSTEGNVGHPSAIDNEEDSELIKDLFSDTKFLTKDHSIENKKFIQVEKEDDDDDDDEKVREVDVNIEDNDEVNDVKITPQHKRSLATATAAWVDEDDEETFISLNAKKLRKLRTKKEIDDRNEGIVSEVVVNGVEYQKRLRAQLSKVNKKQNITWATLPSEIKKRKEEAKKNVPSKIGDIFIDDSSASKIADDDEDEKFESEEDVLEGNLLRTTESKIVTRNAQGNAPLRKGIVKIGRLRDANSTRPAKALITTLEFHPSHPEVLMTASLDHHISLYQIDGKNNAHITSVLFPDLPIYSASIINAQSNDEIIVTGRRPFFYTYDIATGTTSRVDRIIAREEHAYPKLCKSPDDKYIALYGGGGSEIVVISAHTKQLVTSFRMSMGTVKSATFNHDGSKLFVSGIGGEIYEYDMRTMRCSGRYVDEGSLYTSALAMSIGSKYFASGSTSGVVNIYSGDTLKCDPTTNDGSARVIKPEKSLMNLTTPIDRVVFNHDAQMMAMSSHDTFNSLRLVHLPSYTVFSNWPLNLVPLQHVSTMAFSPNSGFFVVGNDKGRVLTFRLFHYPNA